MTLDLALIADAATVDGSGKLNILGVFDQIAAQEFPARHERMCLVLRFIASPAETGDRTVDVVIRDPEGEELARLSGTVGLGGFSGPDGVRIPQVLHLDGFVFPSPGLYSLDVSIDGDVQETLPLRLSRAPRIPEA